MNAAKPRLAERLDTGHEDDEQDQGDEKDE